MYFDASYRPELAAAADDSRPVLAHVLVRRASGVTLGLLRAAWRSERYNGLLTAADGFALVVLPCYLEDDDAPGLVRGDLFPLARKVSRGAMPGGGKGIFMTLSADRVTLLDGSSHVRSTAPDSPGFPDYMRIVRPLWQRSDIALPVAAFNPFLVQRIARALGAGDRGMLRAQFAGLNKPVLVELLDRIGPGGESISPYGVWMPGHAAAASVLTPDYPPTPAAPATILGGARRLVGG